MHKAEKVVAKLYKIHYGRSIATLLASYRDLDPASAEDLVQDTFATALTEWKEKGIPINAQGWLYTVSKNKALNHLKKSKRAQSLDDLQTLQTEEIGFAESVVGDYNLKLLFACAHPDLSPKSQVVITLKYVVNLRVGAISRILGMQLDGVDKLLFRARQKILNEKIILEEPPASELLNRLPIVHKIIYLIFNEGYKSCWGKELLREEMCEEALILNHSLINHGLSNKDTKALHALMLFNAARLPSRFDENGDILDLEHQDRSLWNWDLIALGSEYLRLSQDESVSSYHLEAAIAQMHSTSKTYQATNWRTIAGLYGQLLLRFPNPFAELNYGIALYYAGQKQLAFEILHKLQKHPFISQYYPLNAALGKFYDLDGDPKKAKNYLLKAQAQTGFEKEKKYIQAQIDLFES